MDERSTERGPSRWVIGTSLIGLAIGGGLLGAWLSGNPQAIAFASWRAKMNTCVSLVVAALALLAALRAQRSRSWQWPAAFLAAVPLLVGTLTLLEYATGLDLGIDQLLTHDLAQGESARYPGRMSPNAALSFAMVAMALLLSLGTAPWRLRLGQALALVVASLSGLALVGYLYDVSFLYQPTLFIRISPYTAMTLAALSLGIVALKPQMGVARRVVSQGAGGYVTRRLLIFTVLAPIVLGWLLLKGEKQGLYSASASQALSSTAIVVALTGVLLFLARSLDVIDRKHRQARERAEDASRAKDEFLAMLGHELRNPLSPILTSLQLMKLRAAPDLERERAIIERQAQHMLRLVDDLLDVSRIARGKIALRQRTLELAEIVDSALETASPLLEERVHQVDINVARRGLTLFVDPERMAQVVANLLTNAAKYTPPGGTIRVAATRRDGDVVLSVADNGMGMPPELLPRVFEQFVQGQRALDRAQGGIGLGLAIVRNLVERHGGTVHATSDGRGKGSEFTITLPAAEAPDTAGESPAPQAAAVAEPPAAAQRVLVVDDNRDAAEMLSQALAMAGHDVRTAHDGPTALEVAGQQRPSVVFLDIGLPVMDGYEVARRLRSLDWDSPPTLVAITGYGQPSDRAQSSQAGFDRHLVKPVSLDEVLALATAGTASHQPGPSQM